MKSNRNQLKEIIKDHYHFMQSLFFAKFMIEHARTRLHLLSKAIDTI